MTQFDLLAPLRAALGAGKTDVTRASRLKAGAEALAKRAQRLEGFVKTLEDDAADYVDTPELAMAVNVSLSVGRPLLLTGEPGSGKTQAVYWIALMLGLEDRVLEFQVRSESRAKDLRYDFDAVSWFRESQIAALQKKAGPISKRKHMTAGPLGTAFGWGELSDRPYIVLIDEIDKAPRDFPNDLLLELSQMRFAIDEVEDERVGPPVHRPMIVITSNAERRLPDPFLRRCVVHNIEMDEKTVIDIFTAKLRQFDLKDDALTKEAGKFWIGLSKLQLARKPTVAEFWQALALEAVHGGKTPAAIADALKASGQGLRELKFIAMQFSSQDLNTIAGGPRP